MPNSSADIPTAAAYLESLKVYEFCFSLYNLANQYSIAYLGPVLFFFKVCQRVDLNKKVALIRGQRLLVGGISQQLLFLGVIERI